MNDFFVIDDLQHDSNVVNEDNYDTVSSISNEVSFMGNTHNSFYDNQLNIIENQFKLHEEEYLKADTIYDKEQALDKMKHDTQTYEYWEDCKREAELMEEKNQIFNDHINAQLEIIEKYRK